MRKKVSLAIAGFAVTVVTGLAVASSAVAAPPPSEFGPHVLATFDSMAECLAAKPAKEKELGKPLYCTERIADPYKGMAFLKDVAVDH
jgi:hypothetical protein